MATISQPLPPNVTPAISPESPTGEIFRYILKVPKDASGKEIYTLNDIKALQDWVLERELRRVPRIVDLTSFGGTVRRYEVQPDPDRLRRYGITLGQLQATLTNANATVGGDYITQGQVAMTVRSVGLFGGGLDPVNKVLGTEEPVRRRRHPPRGGTAPDPGNPQPGHHLGQQPADPRRGRGRGGTASPRAVARRTGRGRQQPDAAGADRLLPVPTTSGPRDRP